MLIELLLTLLIILILYLIYSSKEKPADEGVVGNLMKEVGVIQTKLDEREKIREETEKARAERESLHFEEISKFTRTISGTKKRGMIGEHILKEILSSYISTGKVITNLRVKNAGEVEFAWSLDDGKHIPIDSKLPQVTELYNEYSKTEDVEKQKNIKKKIITKVKKNIEEIKKYRNCDNTIDKAILALPRSIIEMVPELISEAQKYGIIISDYDNVIFFVWHLDEQYQRKLESGNEMEYEAMVRQLTEIIKDIADKTETIDRGIKMVKNANDNITELSQKQKRMTLLAKTTKTKKKKK